jgi:hypothetical protein
VKNRLMIKAVMLFVWFSLPLHAIDAKIKVFIPTQDAIYTSQKISISIEVLSSAFSITETQITFPASDKYLVQAPQSASYLGREEVGDEEWQMVHYDYDLYALKSGKIDIPSVLVTFTASMGYGQPKKKFELKSDALSFEVKRPEGVETDQFVLVTKAYTLELKQNPQVNRLIVGDAVEVSVTQRANQVPDILLSQVSYDPNPHMRVYTKEPLLKSGEKGIYDVSRKDSFTFVASVEGNVTFPAQQKVWYDSVKNQLHSQTIPELVYEILPDPQIAIDAQNVKRQEVLLYTLLSVVSLVVVYILFAKRIRTYYREKKARYAKSEAGQFDALLAAIQNRPLHQVDLRYTQWLMHIKPTLIRGGIGEIETLDATFANELRALNEAMVGEEKAFSRQRFTEALKHFRSELLESEVSHDEGLPQTINPN